MSKRFFDHLSNRIQFRSVRSVKVLWAKGEAKAISFISREHVKVDVVNFLIRFTGGVLPFVIAGVLLALMVRALWRRRPKDDSDEDEDDGSDEAGQELG